MTGLEDILDEVNEHWNVLIKALTSAECSYIVTTSNITYEPYSGNEDDDPEKDSIVGKTIIDGGISIKVDVNYDGFADLKLYKEFLMSLLEKYKNSYIIFIDDTSYSPGERVYYFLDKLKELDAIRAKYFKDNRLCEFFSKSFIKFSTMRDQDEDEEEIDRAVNKFVTVQFEVLNEVTEMLRNTARFIPGRLSYYTSKPKEKKLSFNLSRVDLIVFLLALSDTGIIKATPSFLATFSEENLLYQDLTSKEYTKMISVLKTISKIKSTDLGISSNLESIKKKLSSLFLGIRP
jgi:hypothetical protein